MTFTLPADALDWRDRIRKFADDELIPWEVHAELNAGKYRPTPPNGIGPSPGRWASRAWMRPRCAAGWRSA